MVSLVPILLADEAMIDQAIAAAQQTFPTMAALPAYQRAEILGKAVALLQKRREEIARTIAAEAGKALKFARIEEMTHIKMVAFNLA